LGWQLGLAARRRSWFDWLWRKFVLQVAKPSVPAAHVLCERLNIPSTGTVVVIAVKIAVRWTERVMAAADSALGCAAHAHIIRRAPRAVLCRIRSNANVEAKHWITAPRS
jgi:hypothetical protein